MRPFLVLFFVLLIISGCEYGRNCKGYDCFTPPEAIALQITAKDGSGDLIFNGYYHADSVSIYYYDGNSLNSIELSVNVDTLRQRAIIVSQEIGWKSMEGFKDYFLYLDYNETDTIFLDIESRTEDCCTYHPLLAFIINGTMPRLDPEYYFYNFIK